MGVLKVLVCFVAALAIMHQITAEQVSDDWQDDDHEDEHDFGNESNHGEEDHSDHQNRLFFTRFPRFTSCNFTAQPGRTCLSCTQALTCLSSNLGLLTSCRGLFRHCNNGRCSLYQSAACSNSTG